MYPSKFLLFLLSLSLSCLIFSVGFASERAAYNFNADWRLMVGDDPEAAQPDYDDSDWKPVTLPHAWSEDDAFRLAIDELPTGIAWYRKGFVLPTEKEGNKVFLEFEGLRQAGEVWLNGTYIGAHENGVMAFGMDISQVVKRAPEVNVIAVRTDNDWAYREKVSNTRFQWSDRNFNVNYGGITKNVRLHIAPILDQTLPLYGHLGTEGVYIYATDFDIKDRSATIHAESEVRFEPREERRFMYEVTVQDMDGKVVAEFSDGPYVAPPRGRVFASASARVEDLNFWSWGYGYLYDVTTALSVEGEIVDSVTTRTGFRKTEFGDGVFKLNDRSLHIKGYAQRTSNEWPAVGMSGAALAQ